MKFQINYVRGKHHDNFIVEGTTTKELKEKIESEVEKRNWEKENCFFNKSHTPVFQFPVKNCSTCIYFLKKTLKRKRTYCQGRGIYDLTKYDHCDNWTKGGKL